MSELGERVGVGRTAEVFAYGDGLVVKLLRPGFPDRLAEEEGRVAELVAAAYPAAPRCHGLVRLEGRLGVVYERVDGPSLDGRARSRLWAIDRYARQLGELHAAMHDARGDGLPDQRAAFHHAIERAAASTHPAAIAEAHRRVDELPSATSLCHGDFHPGNVLVGRRAVVIDWMTARRGSPSADIARTQFLLVEATLVEPLRGPIGWITNAIRRRILRGYLAGYRARRPLDEAEIATWRLPVLVARGAEDIEAERSIRARAIEVEMARRLANVMETA